MANLNELLEAIANQFRRMGIPEPILHWGHPLMMAIVVFVMGSFVGLAGWRGRIIDDKAKVSKSLADHRTLAPWMFLFMATGYTGGVLSIVHASGGSTAVCLLLLHAVLGSKLSLSI